MKKKGTRYAVAAAMCGMAIAAGHPAAAAEAPASGNPYFARADTNGDGYLSQEEWRRSNGTGKVFTESDDNRDGRLDSSEYVKAAAFMQRERAAGFVDDRMITAKVKTALVRELRSLSINVDTYHGDVLLSGFVDNEAQIKKALQAAASIDGVTRVHNGMVAKP